MLVLNKEIESQAHMNVLKLQAALLALKLLVSDKRGMHARLMLTIPRLWNAQLTWEQMTPPSKISWQKISGSSV